ncbi:hypothetical protein BH10PLA1_BH10PLA1_05680 [soil metagenome]
MSDLQVQIVPHADGVVVTLVGMADMAGAGVLERQLTFLSAKHPRHVVFDLAGLTFISSLAMGVLMQFRRGCAIWGGRITLAAVHPTVAMALKHAALQSLLPMTPTVSDALAAEPAPQPAK